MEFIYAITALLNVFAAMLAWITTRKWKLDYLKNCDEVVNIKNQQIGSLENEVEVLQNLVPIKIQEYFLMIKQRLEVHTHRLQNELEEIQTTIKETSKEISSLRTKEASKIERIKELEERKKHLQNRTNALEGELSVISKYLEVTEFIISDPFYQVVKNPIVDDMVDWFFNNYESAINSVPYNASKGGYRYIYGGPYNALKELSSHFPNSSVRDVILSAEIIEKKGIEWVKKGQY